MKQKRITVEVTPAELRAIREKLFQSGLSIDEFIRRLVITDVCGLKPMKKP